MKERELRFDGYFMQLIRKRARLTFKDLSRRTRTTPRHLSDIEHHKSDPSFSLAVDISEVLKADVSYFVIPTPGRPRPPKHKGPTPSMRGCAYTGPAIRHLLSEI
jgi:transcriptional regulator with XRE-family HTH domain